MDTKKKSLKINMLLNTIKGLMSIFFPLISFPYVSKILGVYSIGRYNFSSSIINYFVLIAGLGINTYAIREGARLREKKEEFSQFSDEVFSINIIATIISYLLLALTIIIVPKFHNYQLLIAILSIQIGFRTIGIEWVYSIFEDYAYITIRSIIFQFLSLILLFAFVHISDDLWVYACITVFSAAGANVLNYFHARKYCRVKFTTKIDLIKHMKPIVVLFAMNIATTIYISSDTTILGFLCSDNAVGIYSVSTKIYNIVKQILSAVVIVSIPRLSALLGDKDEGGFKVMATDIYSTLLTVVTPAVLGIILLRKEIVLIIADNSYINANTSLALLSIALFFCMGAWFWGQCILVPLQKENIVFRITVISAVINIGLNFVLIPLWQENAAALTTIMAEGCAFILCRHEAKKIMNFGGTGKTVLKVGLGCIGMIFVTIVLTPIKDKMFIYTFLEIILCITIYFAIEIVLKNESVNGIVLSLRNKLNRKKT